MLSIQSQLAAELLPKDKKNPEESFMEPDRVNSLVLKAGATGLSIYLTLLTGVYALNPRESWEYLPQAERDAARSAFNLVGVATTLMLSPFAFAFFKGSPIRMGAVIKVGIMVQMIAMCTNAILAFLPTVVVVDPVTHARVFLVRMCEWTPMGGLLTFLSDIIDSPDTESGLRASMLMAFLQFTAIGCALIFPFCTTTASWCFVMTISMTTYCAMFPRMWYKQKKFQATPRGTSYLEIERYDRVRFAYQLISVCTVVWSLIVALYFVNMAAHRLLPVGHFLRADSLAMVVDTTFDVIAKSLYLKVIVDVHHAVFDPEGRAQRQLTELRSLTSALWDSSADLVIISVRSREKIISVFSPSFSRFVGASLSQSTTERAAALLIESRYKNQMKESLDDLYVSTALFVDSSAMPHEATVGSSHLASINSNGREATRALDMLTKAWKHYEEEQNTPKKAEPLFMYELERMNGDDCLCETNVSKHQTNAIVVVARDVTEKHRALNEEREANQQVVAQQKDALTVNRFTRHEVKNGLLAGLELCDCAKSDLRVLERTLPQPSNIMTDLMSDAGPQSELVSQKDVCNAQLEELGKTLHEILDCVLAEAMARDVINEVYKPRLEHLDLKAALINSTRGIGSIERFPMFVDPSLPYLELDPQLLRYIYRNAVSNANKYGKDEGRILTKVLYYKQSNDLIVEVINEPGKGHAELMANKDSADKVFQQGAQLHKNMDANKKKISAGDGAWIMQKCAKAMGGHCTIRFEESQTVFRFQCKAAPLEVVAWKSSEEFQVPAETWGVAVDDSPIQRKLLARIFKHAGVAAKKQMILGETSEEVYDVAGQLSRLLEQNPGSNVLVLVDENLDFNQNTADPLCLSGSVLMKDVLSKLSKEQESRVLCLVRSADDTSEQVALFTSRTHGFFPKAPMRKENVQEVLAPLWADRFLTSHPKKQEVQPVLVVEPSQPEKQEVKPVLTAEPVVPRNIVEASPSHYSPKPGLFKMANFVNVEQEKAMSMVEPEETQQEKVLEGQTQLQQPTTTTTTIAMDGQEAGLLRNKLKSLKEKREALQTRLSAFQQSEAQMAAAASQAVSAM